MFLGVLRQLVLSVFGAQEGLTTMAIVLFVPGFTNFWCVFSTVYLCHVSRDFLGFSLFLLFSGSFF